MRLITLAVVMMAGAALFAPETASARAPFFGNFSGTCTVNVPIAKKKKKRIRSQARAQQNGPSNYDMRAVVNAAANGEKFEIVLDLNADNTGTVTINGQVVAGPTPKSLRPLAAKKAKPKKLKFKLKATGTATFVGPVRQDLSFAGKYKGSPFNVKGVLDLDPAGGLILDTKVTFKKKSPLGKKMSFSFQGDRT